MGLNSEYSMTRWRQPATKHGMLGSGPAVRLQESLTASLSLSFLICKMGMTAVIKWKLIFETPPQSVKEVHFLLWCKYSTGLPRWFSHEESACQCRRRGFDPWVGKIPRRRKWQPTPVFLPQKSHGKRCLEGYSSWGQQRVGHNLATKQQVLYWHFTFLMVHCCSLPFFLSFKELIAFMMKDKRQPHRLPKEQWTEQWCGRSS